MGKNRWAGFSSSKAAFLVENPNMMSVLNVASRKLLIASLETTKTGF